MAALKITHPPFTIFAPKSPSTARSGSELRFARWNNANAEKFNRRERATKEIEDEIRREKRYEAASKITEIFENSGTNTTTTTTTTESETTSYSKERRFKSIGTPSSPSRPSIPGRKSKYSKPPKPYQNPNSDNSHPAFQNISRVSSSSSRVLVEADKNVSIGENGVSYKITNAPFEFQYSYTETPKVKPLGLREPPFVPFGPTTMPRPWTGRAPLPGTKKKLPEFDSFKLPPAHKKGVKPVQAPGPFLAGSGPKHASSREEILGEPLTKEEIQDLVKSCVKSRRQLNMGRDGLTHNMLENIHALWKRRRVCKIKCKGVCTVDMDNVCHQLEDKTGGKIIYKKGGVLFLFRGRNYNYMSRPRFPLMLWKPVTPVYPRLIVQAPEGLTAEEADEMRKRGRELPPICKLGKNGVYSNLVKHVREAFEECELVRINCEGMNGSDYRKIGAKLKDLVPCVLISFEREHILMWRGRDWKSTLMKVDNESEGVMESETHGEIISPSNFADSLSVEYPDSPDLLDEDSSDDDLSLDNLSTNVPLVSESSSYEGSENDQPSEATETNSSVMNVDASSSTLSDGMWRDDDESAAQAGQVMNGNGSATIPESTGCTDDKSEATLSPTGRSLQHASASDNTASHAEFQTTLEGSPSHIESKSSSSTCTKGVLRLLNEAVESGRAVILDDTSLDANIVYERVVALHKVAPCGPVFRHRLRKKAIIQKSGKQDNGVLKVEAVVTVSGARSEKKSYRDLKIKDLKQVYPDDILPHGSLGVDELAKLLS